MYRVLVQRPRILVSLASTFVFIVMYYSICFMFCDTCGWQVIFYQANMMMMLCRLQWNEYKIISLTHKMFNTTHPPYLYDLISIQPPHCHNTRSSPYVSLVKPSSSLSHSSLLPTRFTSSFEPASYITQNSASKLLTPFSATLIWTCRFNLLHCYETVLSLRFVVCMFHNINYCFVLVRFIQPPCISNLVPFLSMHASAAGVCACVGRCDQFRNGQDSKGGLVTLIEVCNSERCLESSCSQVSLCYRRVEKLFHKSARGMWTQPLVKLSWRRTTSLNVLYRRGLPTRRYRESREVPTEAGRLVRTPLLDAVTPAQQSIGLLVVVRRRSQNNAGARRKHVDFVDSPLTSGWRPGDTRCCLLAADPLATHF